MMKSALRRNKRTDLISSVKQISSERSEDFIAPCAISLKKYGYLWKSKSWQLEATGVDGNVRLFGVNIFDYEWVDTKERVQVEGLSYDAPIYTVTIRHKQYKFAAGERSNCVWNFYVYTF